MDQIVDHATPPAHGQIVQAAGDIYAANGTDPIATMPAADPTDAADPAESAEMAGMVEDTVHRMLEAEDSFCETDGGAVDLVGLHAEAVATSAGAVARADDARREELRAMGARMAAEQERMHAVIMSALPPAVRMAAANGQRVATILEFSGADKLDEFSYLYMLKGPHGHDQRNEMRAMGVKPLLPRLRRELQAAGFGVHHAWQRATNQNTLAVTW